MAVKPAYWVGQLTKVLDKNAAMRVATAVYTASTTVTGMEPTDH